MTTDNAIRDDERTSARSTTPLRVAVIAPPWLSVPPEAYGGTESVIDVLCRGVQAAGHDVLLVTTGDSTCPVESVHRFETAVGVAGAPAICEPAHAAFGYDAAERWGAHLIHDHTLSGPAIGGLTSPVPVVATSHGPLTGNDALLFGRLSTRVPLVAISRAQASSAHPRVRVAAVIHHGVDTRSFAPAASKDEIAVFLGRMSPDKGVDVAIRVARKADVPLFIAAKLREPAEKEYFDSVVRPLLGGSVEYVGELERPAQRALLARASCLLNPIRWNEPFGLVAIEALASGTPVVTTPRGAMPEIVVDGRTGFLRQTVAGLADAVRLAGSLDPEVCRRSAARYFSMERMAADHIGFYRTVLARLSRRS